MRPFMIPCDFGGRKVPFPIYVGEPKPDNHPLQNQSWWLSSVRGGTVPQDVMDSFEKLHNIAKEHNVSFEELCVYAMDEASKSDRLPEDLAMGAIGSNSGGGASSGSGSGGGVQMVQQPQQAAQPQASAVSSGSAQYATGKAPLIVQRPLNAGAETYYNEAPAYEAPVYNEPVPVPQQAVSQPQQRLIIQRPLNAGSAE